MRLFRTDSARTRDIIPLTKITWEISSCFKAAVESGSKVRCACEIHTDSPSSF